MVSLLGQCLGVVKNSRANNASDENCYWKSGDKNYQLNTLKDDKVIGSTKSLIIKAFVQPKLSLNYREFFIWKERGRGEREKEEGREREGWAGGWVGQQASIFMVRLVRVRELEWRDRDT
jgi:hypothetical protein